MQLLKALLQKDPSKQPASKGELKWALHGITTRIKIVSVESSNRNLTRMRRTADCAALRRPSAKKSFISLWTLASRAP